MLSIYSHACETFYDVANDLLTLRIVFQSVWYSTTNIFPYICNNVSFNTEAEPAHSWSVNLATDRRGLADEELVFKIFTHNSIHSFLFRHTPKLGTPSKHVGLLHRRVLRFAWFIWAKKYNYKVAEIVCLINDHYTMTT